MKKICILKFDVAIILISSIFLFVSLPCSAQQISLADGSLPVIGENTELRIENPLSDDNTIILTPKTGHKLAKVTIPSGTSTSVIYGEKITYKMKNEYFLAEGNAKIDWNKNILTGPVKIEFDPAKNILTLFGTEKNPASVNSPKWASIWQAEKWLLTFTKPKNGKRKFTAINSVNHLQDIPRSPKKTTDKDTKFKPKTSGPKN